MTNKNTRLIEHLSSTEVYAVTFPVSDVEVDTSKPQNSVPVEQALRKQLAPKSKIESYSQNMVSGNKTDILQYDGHCLVGTIGQCFAEHRPLVLSPDVIWLTILQGFANHINLNPEKYRDKFVDFDGQETIEVRRDDFVKGKADNPWEEVFPKFTDQIKDYIGDNYDMIMADFSTTGALERAAYEVTLMDAVKSYFNYEFQTCCGIPNITLEGTKFDWEKLYKKAEKLGEFDLDWWMDELLPVLQQYVNVFDGEIDLEFWERTFKERYGSGGPYINGHILALFPYLKGRKDELIKNKCLDWKKEGMFRGANYDDFPSGLSSSKFIWKYLALEFDMTFYAGFFGAAKVKETNILNENALKPVIGWCITEKKGENEKISETEHTKVESKSVGRLPIRQEITVLPADDPQKNLLDGQLTSFR